MNLLNRRSFLTQASRLAAAGFAAPLWTHAASWAWPMGISGDLHLLRGKVGYFTKRGGTIGYYHSPEAIAIVDTQFLDTAPLLLTALRELGEAPIDLLVNTHHHADHTGGNMVFKDIAKTHVAHFNACKNLERVATERNELDKQLIPTTTYQEDWSHRLSNQDIVTLYYFGAGHTNGDSLVHFETDNVVHTGDLVFNRRFPYIDKSSGASIESWIEVLQKARRTFDRDTRYIFGHAAEGYPVTGTHEDLKAMEHYLHCLLKFMKRARRQGRTLDDLKATVTTIPGAPEWQGPGIERSLDAAWAELETQ